MIGAEGWRSSDSLRSIEGAAGGESGAEGSHWRRGRYVMRGGGVGGLKDRRHWRRSGMRCKGHARGVRAAVAHRTLLRQPCLEGARLKSCSGCSIGCAPFLRAFAADDPSSGAASESDNNAASRNRHQCDPPLVRMAVASSSRALAALNKLGSALLPYASEARQSFVLRRRVGILQTNRDPRPVGIERGRTPIRIRTLVVYAIIQ